MASTQYSDYNNLSKEEVEFINERKVDSTKSIDEWLNYFIPLAHLDKKGDMLRRNGNYVKAFWAFWIVFGLYMGFLYVFNGVAMKEVMISLIIIVVSSTLLIISDKWFDKYKKRDIPNLMRGFVVPYLEFLEKKAGGDAHLKMHLDLSKIHDLEEEIADLEQREKINYMQGSVGLKDGSILELTIDGTGVKRPYYSRYKLKHSISIENTYNGTDFQLLEDTGLFRILEEGNKIILQDQYEEQSESPIESDTGPDLEALSERLSTMGSVVERKTQA